MIMSICIVYIHDYVYNIYIYMFKEQHVGFEDGVCVKMG